MVFSDIRPCAAKVAALALPLVLTCSAAHGQPQFDASTPIRILHAFQDPGPRQPVAIVEAPDGSLYGRAIGQRGLFRLANDGSLLPFDFGSAPVGLVTGPAGTRLIRAADGSFYGMTSTGGAFGGGAVFKIDTGGLVTVLHSFNPPTEGSVPTALTQIDGVLYGTNSNGGPGFDAAGTVFSLALDGTFQLLHTFRTSAVADGIRPILLIAGSDGILYGATFTGAIFGATGGGGTVFRLTTDGVFGVVKDFTDSTPVTSLIEGLDGNLYATVAPRFGPGLDGLIRITKSGFVTVLHALSASEGLGAGGLMQTRDGRLFGVLAAGPIGTGIAGAIFRASVDGTFSVLHSTTIDEGVEPNFLSETADGRLIGTAASGGARGGGTVFEIDSVTGALRVLHNFGGSDEGAAPAALVQSDDDVLWGATSGAFRQPPGGLFRMSVSGTITTVHPPLVAGATGPALLTAAPDGGVFWTEPTLGIPRGIYHTAVDGTTTAVHTFVPSDGVNFGLTALMLSTDGMLYATTFTGPPIAFVVDPATGILTRLRTFTLSDANGYEPNSLLEGQDGSLYGSTWLGPMPSSPLPPGLGSGTVFKMDRDGSIVWAHAFLGQEGMSPRALVQRADGRLYGFTVGGGLYNLGTLFSVTPDGAFTLLHAIAPGEGAPTALAAGSDGTIYGTTSNGGGQQRGTIFRLEDDGSMTTIHEFNGHDGANPGVLFRGRDGSLFGTASTGGPRGGGVVFQLAARDGTIPTTGGVVADSVFGARAQVVIPDGVLSAPANVSIDVLRSGPAVETPAGFTGAGTLFVTIDLTPTPVFPLPAPGLTLVLPLAGAMPAGSPLVLYRIDPATDTLVPSLDALGRPIVGTVNDSGDSASFAGIVHLSTVVGLIPDRDTTPPEIVSASATPSDLWPPNYKLVPIAVAVTATDAVTAMPTCQIVRVSAIETAAWRITGALTLEVESARNGTGNGRVYSIVVSCSDDAGNASEVTVMVTVAHDRRGGS